LPRFINADLIAAGIAPFAPEAAAIRAGRLMLEEIKRSAQQGKSFSFETTLSGRGYLRHIKHWRCQGYHVETAIARVAERVRQGGHNVAEAAIRRRFTAGWNNFQQTYRVAVDDWAVYDNTGNLPILLEWGENS
jgi:predicted ABC-type ATPase